jgi:hypothetical protein
VLIVELGTLLLAGLLYGDEVNLGVLGVLSVLLLLMTCVGGCGGLDAFECKSLRQ